MHLLLRIVHHLLVAIHDFQAGIYQGLYHYGPGVLSRHTMPCAWLICLLCLFAAGYDLIGKRRFDALLWAGMAGLLFTALSLEADISSLQTSGDFALAVVAVALLLLTRGLYQRFWRRA
jgi:hypothetical protein